MHVTLTNIEMDNRIKALTPLLEHADMVGYAAARNYRRLTDQNKEYQDQRDELVKQYGEPCDGGYRIDQTMPGWSGFVDALVPYAEISHEVEVYQIPMREAAGLITGRQMIELEWMFTEEGEQD